MTTTATQERWNEVVPRVTVECPETGEVDLRACQNDPPKPTMVHLADCPTCHGEGVVRPLTHPCSCTRRHRCDGCRKHQNRAGHPDYCQCHGTGYVAIAPSLEALLRALGDSGALPGCDWEWTLYQSGSSSKFTARHDDPLDALLDATAKLLDAKGAE